MKISDDILIDRHTYEIVLHDVVKHLPQRTRGIFAATRPEGPAEKCFYFDSNIKNRPEWKPLFQSYSDPHLVSGDGGFVVDPVEQVSLWRQMAGNNLTPVGLFHTHRILPAVFTKIDRDLHLDFALWHMIVSVRGESGPEVRAFRILPHEVRPAKIVLVTSM